MSALNDRINEHFENWQAINGCNALRHLHLMLRSAFVTGYQAGWEDGRGDTDRAYELALTTCQGITLE